MTGASVSAGDVPANDGSGVAQRLLVAHWISAAHWRCRDQQRNKEACMAHTRCLLVLVGLLAVAPAFAGPSQEEAARH